MLFYCLLNAWIKALSHMQSCYQQIRSLLCEFRESFSSPTRWCTTQIARICFLKTSRKTKWEQCLGFCIMLLGVISSWMYIDWTLSAWARGFAYFLSRREAVPQWNHAGMAEAGILSILSSGCVWSRLFSGREAGIYFCFQRGAVICLFRDNK